MMRIGIDFDNTIISYDVVFHEAAAEWGYDVGDIEVSKTAVRDRLRDLGDEEKWIELQGYVYGKKMAAAAPFEGVLDFFEVAKKRAAELFIVSHKTKHPFKGPQYDLHAATRHWLDKLGLSESRECGIGEKNIYLELTKEAKADRIYQLKCDYFIDDLPEFLNLESFPERTKAILFDPLSRHSETWDGLASRSWNELAALLMK